jgi:hypothetical protein
MKYNNMNKPLTESLNNRKSQDRATEVFNKLLAKQKRPKNPFDEIRSQSYPSTNLKPGELNDTI